MDIYTKVLGNLCDDEWCLKASSYEIENIILTQWTAQKSRFVLKSEQGKEYAVALNRYSQILDGDIIAVDELHKHLVVLRIELNEVLMVDLGALLEQPSTVMVQTSLELGHAIGNQHWPAVVKGTNVYIPLTVDKRVMDSVMRTHHFEGISFRFIPGSEIIPFLAPHEIRNLFGSIGSDSQVPHHGLDADSSLHPQLTH